MKSRIIGVALALFVVGALWTWANPTRAQESHGARWQYCSVGLGVPFAPPDKNRYFSKLVYFSVEGVDRAREVGLEGKDPWDSFRRAVAQLGTDGWEMVGVTGENPVAYFKRPTPQK